MPNPLQYVAADFVSAPGGNPDAEQLRQEFAAATFASTPVVFSHLDKIGSPFVVSVYFDTVPDATDETAADAIVAAHTATGPSVAEPPAPGESPIGAYPPDHLSGLQITYNSASTYDIEPGSCRSDDDGENLDVSSAITVDITSSGANGLDTGSEAPSTWYSVWVIGGGGNPVSALLSANPTAPTLPGSYTVKRRVGWVRNDGSSDFVPTTMVGNGRDRWVLYDQTSIFDREPLIGGASTTFAAVDLSPYVPPTSVFVRLQSKYVGNTSGANRAILRPSGESADNIMQQQVVISTGTFADVTAFFDIRTDSAQEIEYRIANGGDSLSLNPLGYVDSL